MKHKQVKWQRTTCRVARTCQIEGPIRHFKTQCAVQKNNGAMKTFKKYGLIPYTLNKPDLNKGLLHIATTNQLIL